MEVTGWIEHRGIHPANYKAARLEDECGGSNHRYTMNHCLHCNTPTINPKYCSKSCSAKETNKSPKRVAKPKFCKDCGTLVPSGRTKCDDCLAVKDFTLAEAIYTKHHKSSAFALVRTRARALVKDREQVCVECGYNKHVEVCHVKPISSYEETTLLSVINSPDNLKLLCPNCHWEYDRSLALSS